MKRHLSFPDIGQFRNAVKKVRDRATYHAVPTPKLKFTGTVKLHGTNAGVVQHVKSGEFWAQSREHVITITQDNASFARFVEDNSTIFTDLLNVVRGFAADIYGATKLHDENVYVCVYGEWCGAGIMKNKAAISQVSPKMFVIFGIGISNVLIAEDGNDDQDRVWFTPAQIAAVYRALFGAMKPEVPIYSIYSFPTWELEIDFARPEEFQNKLVALTDEVERECPVAKHFGSIGIGEGIVWRCYDTWLIPGHLSREEGEVKTVGLYSVQTSDIAFKVKGEKHSESKTKNLAPVDVEKVNSIRGLVDKVVTQNRLESSVEKMRAQNIEISVENTSVFLKTIGNDVLKEEGDTIDTSGLNRKDVMPEVNRTARQWWMSYLNDLAFKQ